MNYLKGKQVYLAGPITAVSDDGIGWRNIMTPDLIDLGLIVDDPCAKTANGLGEVKDDKAYFKQLAKDRKFNRLKEEFYPVVRKDLRSVDKADFLIAVYDPTVHMMGTIHEVIMAHIQRKPILVYCAPEHLDEFNAWFLTFIKVEWLFSSWIDLIDYLEEVDEGKINKSYWTL